MMQMIPFGVISSRRYAPRCVRVLNFRAGRGTADLHHFKFTSEKFHYVSNAKQTFTTFTGEPPWWNSEGLFTSLVNCFTVPFWYRFLSCVSWTLPVKPLTGKGLFPPLRISPRLWTECVGTNLGTIIINMCTNFKTQWLNLIIEIVK